MTRHTALVTGASSGIGRELAKQFAAGGDDVVLTARRESRLRDLADEIETADGVTATVVTADLTAPDQPETLFETVQSMDLVVHTVVNNAGYSAYGRFDEIDSDQDDLMLDLNVGAVTRLTKLFVREMIDRGEGAILNTASMAGMVPAPNNAVYSATKAYVRSFSEALAHELEPEGITVTALCPGPVDTELLSKGDLDESAVADGPVNDPASVARAGYQGLQDGKRVVVPSRRMQILSQLTRILPRKTAVSMAARTYEE